MRSSDNKENGAIKHIGRAQSKEKMMKSDISSDTL